MPTTPSKLPAAGSYTLWRGLASWNYPARITASDNSISVTAYLTDASISRPLLGKGFGFTTADLPVGAVIDGFEISIEGRKGDASGTAWVLYGVSVTKDGSTELAFAPAKEAQIVSWSDNTADVVKVVTFTMADLGKPALNDADIRTANFGLAILATGSDAVDVRAGVDSFRVAVVYHLEVTASPFGLSSSATLGAPSPAGGANCLAPGQAAGLALGVVYAFSEASATALPNGVSAQAIAGAALSWGDAATTPAAPLPALSAMGALLPSGGGMVAVPGLLAAVTPGLPSEHGTAFYALTAGRGVQASLGVVVAYALVYEPAKEETATLVYPLSCGSCFRGPLDPGGVALGFLASESSASVSSVAKYEGGASRVFILQK